MKEAANQVAQALCNKVPGLAGPAAVGVGIGGADACPLNQGHQRHRHRAQCQFGDQAKVGQHWRGQAVRDGGDAGYQRHRG